MTLEMNTAGRAVPTFGGVDALGLDSRAFADPSARPGADIPLQAAEILLRDARTPVEQGIALRLIDGLSGRGPDRTPAKPDAASGPSRLDETRNTGRGSVRPTLGQGAPPPPTITPGPGMPGFPHPPAQPATGDGSGPHGVQEPSFQDRAFKQVAYRAADAADAIGYNNAARNLRHYLGNSGETLQVDPARMRADLPRIAADMDAKFNTQVRDVALAHVKADYKGRPMQFQITTPWNGAYATKGQSPDWFYAVGGFSYAHTASVTVTPGRNGAAQVHIESQLHVFDRYNWDGGKQVTIGPLTVTDEQMGKLNKTGLAREYETHGTSTGPTLDGTVPRTPHRR